MRSLAALIVMAAVTACGAPDGLTDGTRPVLMVSGRDDHGLVASQNIVLRSAPDGADVVGHLPDGTLAQVRAVRGTQVQVSASGVTGWVDDFFLRGELRLSGPPPDCRVQLAGRTLPAGTRVEVLSLYQETAKVRLLDPPRTVGTLPTSAIVELAPIPGQSCPKAGSGRTDHGH
jgi:hypothetical protein